MTTFEQLVKERRSAKNFLPGNPITREELNKIVELVKFGPSAFNLKHPHFLVVMDPEMKEKIKHTAYGQNKIDHASAVIVVTGDKKAYQDAARIHEGLMMLGIMSKEEYEAQVNTVHSIYEKRGEQFQLEEAIRNASISAMLFMLAAKDKGWDTCPMIGFDPVAVRELLNIEEQYEIVMMIAVGKENVANRHPRGYRKPVNEFVTYI